MDDLSPIDSTVALSNDKTMPMITVGTYHRDQQVVKTAIESAIRSGYRAFEISTIYHNEEGVGEAIQEMIAEGVVTREDLFISLKVWTPPDVDLTTLDPQIEESLSKLQLSYVDMLISHIPVARNLVFDSTISQIWKIFEKFVMEEKSLSLGVANWDLDQIKFVMEWEVISISLLHLDFGLYQPPLSNMEEYCSENNILISKMGTFGGPEKITYSLTTNLANPIWNLVEVFDDTLSKICTYRRCSPFQIAVFYAVHSGFIIKPEGSTAIQIFNLTNFVLFGDELISLKEAESFQRMRFLHISSGFLLDAPILPVDQ